MLEIDKKEASKTQREFGKGTDFTFKINGTTFLIINKWLHYHITRWPTDLSVIEISEFIIQTRKAVALRYHHLGIMDIVCDATNHKSPFLQTISGFDLSGIIPGLLAQSCTVKNLPLEQIELELRAKYATYPDLTIPKFG